MGLFSDIGGVLNPITLQGVSQGLLQGREAQIAQGNVEADRQVRQQIAQTDALRAKNEALAPFRGEIARQLQVHDTYRPYHQAGLMQQYGTSDANDPRVQGDMAAWEQTVDPYRQALATDDPDQVRQIIQNGVQKHGGLPPVVAPPASRAAPAPDSPGGASPYQFGVPFGLADAVRQSFQPPDPLALIQNGVEIPQVVRGSIHLDTPGFDTVYNGTARPASPAAPAGIDPRTGAGVGAGVFGPPAPHAIHAAATTDRPDPSTAPVPTGPAGGPKSMTPPPASLLPTTATFSDPALARAQHQAALELLHRHPVGTIGPAPPAPPLPPAPGTPNPQAATSPTAPPPPAGPYDPSQPNPAPGPVAGTGPAGSQSPSLAQGAPFIAQGADGTAVLRVPGVGDLPAVTAQRVIDQAKADPAVVATAKFATYINQVAVLGPGVDPQVVDHANTAYATAWNSALQRYGELDKLPTDQLNTLQTAYSGLLTARTAAARTPAEIGELNARAQYEREQARVLAPKTEQDIQDSITRNLGALHQAGLNDAQAQHDVAAAAHEDAQRQNIPNENRIKFLDADLRGRAELLKANAYWNAYSKTYQGDLAYIQQYDGVMANAYSNLGAGTASNPYNTVNAWIVFRRADKDPTDPIYQRAKEGALLVLKGASALANGGQRELVNGPVAPAPAWIGHDLYAQGRKASEFANNNDPAAKAASDGMQSWTAFKMLMDGTGTGSIVPSQGELGVVTGWANGLSDRYQKWKQAHPGWFYGWGAKPEPQRAFIPPNFKLNGVTPPPIQPPTAPPPAPYPPSASAPSP